MRHTLTAVLAVTLAGCVPETTTTPPASTPAQADTTVDAGHGVTADCDGVQSRRGRSHEWFVTATPDDLRRCLADPRTDPGKLLYRAAGPVFRDDENASGVRFLLDTGIDPDVSPYGGKSTPLGGWSRTGWRTRYHKPLPLRRSPEADEAVVRAFLEAGADPNAAKTSGYGSGMSKPVLPLLREASRKGLISTRSHAATWGQNWRVLHAAIGSHRPTGSIEAVLEHGADPNLTVAPGQDWTALHVAAFMSRPDIIRLLLEHGADPHAVTTSRKWTALHAFAEGGAGPGAAESGKLLLDAGIDPKLKDRKGRTAWDLVSARLTPEQLAAVAADDPEARRLIARLQTASGG